MNKNNENNKNSENSENSENVIRYKEVNTVEAECNQKSNENVNKGADANIIKTEPTEDVNLLSGNNKVDVEIEPDIKANGLHLQICSCSFVFNWFTRK